jgi:hypothetical protein
MTAGRWRTAEEKPMETDTTVRVTRHSLTTQKPCDVCSGALEKRAPVVPPVTCEALAALNLKAQGAAMRRGYPAAHDRHRSPRPAVYPGKP